MSPPVKGEVASNFVLMHSLNTHSTGPFPEAYLSWRWFFWLQLIFGGFVQILHFVLVPETRSRILLEREVNRRRKAGEEVWAEHEEEHQPPFLRRAFTTYSRPVSWDYWGERGIYNLATSLILSHLLCFPSLRCFYGSQSSCAPVFYPASAMLSSSASWAPSHWCMRSGASKLP